MEGIVIHVWMSRASWGDSDESPRAVIVAFLSNFAVSPGYQSYRGWKAASDF
jgi:hypothetical protein